MNIQGEQVCSTDPHLLKAEHNVWMNAVADEARDAVNGLPVQSVGETHDLHLVIDAEDDGSARAVREGSYGLQDLDGPDGLTTSVALTESRVPSP